MNKGIEIEDVQDFGLSSAAIKNLRRVFEKRRNIKKVVLYGSRAKGNYRRGSNIDLTIMNPLIFEEFLRSNQEIDDLLLHQIVDLSQYESIDNASLKKHIDSMGKVFYERCSRTVLE